MAGIRIDDSIYIHNWFSDICSPCKNLVDGIERKCKAFEKIPLPIWEGENSHRQPYKGDNGIRFEPIAK